MACTAATVRAQAGGPAEADFSYAAMRPGMVSNAYAGARGNMGGYNMSSTAGMHYTMAPLQYMSRGRIAGGALPEGALFRAASTAQRMGIPVSAGTMTGRPNPYLADSYWSREALPASAAVTTVRASINPQGFGFATEFQQQAPAPASVEAAAKACVPSQALFTPPGGMQCVASPTSYGDYKSYGTDPDFARAMPYLYAQSRTPTVCTPDGFTLRGL